MSNVKFLRGTQAKFDQLTAFNEGAFYLTSDTNRLYYANSSTKASYLNKYIYTTTNEGTLRQAVTAGLLKKGDFAYLTENNALVAMLSDTGWKQVNEFKDTNDTIKTTGMNVAKEVKDGNITFTYTLTQQKYDVNNQEVTDKDLANNPVTGTFVIAQADIAQIVAATAVGVVASVNDEHVATIKTSGVGSAGSGFTVKGTGSVQVNSTTGGITIDGTDTTYTLGSEAASTSIALKDSNTTTVGSVAIKAGQQISVTGAKANEISVAHAVIDQETGKAITSDITNDSTIDVVTGITQSNGHITKIDTAKYTLKPHTYNISAVSANDKGQVSVTLADENGAGEAVVSGADLFFYKDKAKKTKILNQGVLDFYTTTEIDNKFKDLNGMTYKGAYPSTSVQTVPEKNVQIGDTYMISTNGTTFKDYKDCRKGDLLIATGTEGADGYITGEIAWTYIPAGDDEDKDTQFGLKAHAADNKIAMVNETNSNTEVGSITMSSGDNIVVDATASGENDITFTVKHGPIVGATSYTDNTTATGKEKTLNTTGLPVVSSITKDSYGHVSGYVIDTYKLPADKDTTYTLSTESNKITLTDSDTTMQHVTIAAGDKMSVATTGESDNATITIEHGDVSTTPNTNTASPSAGQTFKAITALGFDKGHVNEYTTTTYTLPNDTVNTDFTYEITGDTNKTTASIKTSVTDSKQDVDDTFVIKTTGSLNIGVNSDTKEVTMDIVWGSF